ncbi:DegT/DnrJ/EryC1/StrS family aminotransferase [Isoptericola sp. b441]|uniref:DegT/DnrJ/EryC1/StrS family aminotransferase n=1 Tax=Actinotalea lenta TaxID=3064654 RepID=A0ABT9DAG3_9CELL|nr:MULTISPECIES: DegT/DnrJ/EryC1/StrS family aminotransferase [unclassified Isoptericola]MDO8107899.1 DegT/DnrJ/EryC1/StrS family aminotransferase [Isoptericola sp. b441]MDO8120433.1 DegT/DnrJ/EryC1/StrS family aminotransferase [Isoptericola sp. b490]
MNAHHEVTSALARRTGTNPADWFLLFKARYGMQVVFEALRSVRGPGDVVTQAFTCATAVDPILVGGLHPVYADVARDSLAIDAGRVEVPTTARAVVLQHTFGIVDVDNAERLRAAAHAAGALLVEDAAHAAGRMATSADGTPLADVSIHSFGVEKLLPTRFGGAVWVSPDLADAGLRARLAGDLAGLPPMGARLDLAARTYRAQVRVLNRVPGAFGRGLRGALTTAGIFEPAIAPVEVRGGLPYRPMAPSVWVSAQVAGALRTLDGVERTRGAAVAAYLHELAELVDVPGGVRGAAPLVRFPFFASDGATAEQLVAALSRQGVYAGRWYRPALFPGVADPDRYGYDPSDPALTTTHLLVERVVNLPTRVGESEAARISALVRAELGV